MQRVDGGFELGGERPLEVDVESPFYAALQVEVDAPEPFGEGVEGDLIDFGEGPVVEVVARALGDLDQGLEILEPVVLGVQAMAARIEQGLVDPSRFGTQPGAVDEHRLEAPCPVELLQGTIVEEVDRRPFARFLPLQRHGDGLL